MHYLLYYILILHWYTLNWYMNLVHRQTGTLLHQTGKPPHSGALYSCAHPAPGTPVHCYITLAHRHTVVHYTGTPGTPAQYYITLIHLANYYITLAHWYTGKPGPLLHYTGTLVHWYNDTSTLVRYTGTLVHRYTGTMTPVHWCITLVHYTGALVHYTGTLVHCILAHP